MGEWNYSTKHS